MSRKKILFISMVQIYPCHTGGHLRTYSLAKALANKGYDVSVYSLTGRKKDYLKRKKSFYTFNDDHASEYVDLNPIRGILQFLCYRLNWPNIWLFLPFVKFWAPKKLKKMAGDSDIVIIDFIFPIKLSIVTKDKKTFINSHNLESELIGDSSLMKRLFSSWVRKKESRAHQFVDGVIACAETDFKFYVEHAKRTNFAWQIPNGVEPHKSTKRNSAMIKKEIGISPEVRLIIFSASQFGPNIEAYNELKRFQQKNKDWLESNKICFLIAGSVSNGTTRELSWFETGFVDDIRIYFEIADAAINPIKSGSGTNVKMFDYMDYNLPIISTSYGKRGFHLVDEYSYISLNMTDIKTGLEKYLSFNDQELLLISTHAKKNNKIYLADHIDNDFKSWFEKR